jgi:hypothetical protein
MAKITEEELSMLSDEERAAIEEDNTDATKSVDEIRAEEEAAELAAAKESGAGVARRNADSAPPAKTEAEIAAEALLAKEAADKANEGEKTAEELEAEAKAKESADAEAAAQAKAAEEAEAKRVADEAAALSRKVAETISPKTAPAFVLEVEKKFGTADEINEKMKALDVKFEDGDITLAAYNKERADYVEVLTQMTMFATINEQVQKGAAEKAWKDSQAKFFSENPEYSVVRAKNVSIVDAVNRILATPESKTMTDEQIFAAAKVEVDAAFYPEGRPTKQKVTTDSAPVDDSAKKKAAAEEEAKKKALEEVRKAEAERAASVKTLAKVPVADTNVADNKFDAIDLLSGLAYEAAVAQLSEAERAIYASRE